MTRKCRLGLGAAALSLLVGAAGDEPTISQKDKEFSQAQMSLHPGQTVRFSNDDTIVHNITVREPNGTTRRGVVQRPGDITPMTFADIGAYTVYCLIHPKMRMSVTVQ